MRDELPSGRETSLEELVQSAHALVSKDRHGYDHVCETLFTCLYGTAMAIVIPKVPTQDIDEVVSDVLADFFLYIEKGIPVPHVRALLNTIGRRRIADFHRNREGTPPTAAFDAERHEHVHSSDRMEDERIGQVLTNDILDGLPSELRSVAYARFVAYLSVEQTAEELNLTIDIVKKRSQLARAQLRVIVSEGFRYDA